MSMRLIVQVVCNGCGEESEPREVRISQGETVQLLRDDLKRKGWRWDFGRSGRDFCPLCVRCEKQQGQLVVEPPMPLFARSP